MNVIPQAVRDAFLKAIGPIARAFIRAGISPNVITTLGTAFGPLPGAGFFCNGEIGPVGTTNFVHGYTASAALLCAAE